MAGAWKYNPQGDSLGYDGPAQISFGPNNLMPMNVEVTLQTVIEMIPGTSDRIHHWTGNIKTPAPIPPGEFVRLISAHMSEIVNIRLPDGQTGKAYIEYLANTCYPHEVSFAPPSGFKEYMPGEIKAVVKLTGTGKPPYVKD